ncbi:precorrin-3B C(17)-methyltransferase [Azotosporobacter soli]|uniref:precorrin-3B C(17)-methyltransferase n=1 Tax=Azotosporobacter soli TaxID=3055040 RepID=UPI0031FEB78F
MSPRAQQAVADATRVVGYTKYVELIEDLIKDKEVVSTGMMQEIDRCQKALDLAMEGHRVAVVSSGDPGIYGMAGLVLELATKCPAEDRPEVEVISGISAVGASAACLGAPLMHDFAVISLSDLLTPWEVIRRRVELAAEGDFVIALYNPKSVKRNWQIEEVKNIVLKHRPVMTPVGIVHHASRDGEAKVIANLGGFTDEHIDMFSMVIIGNSRTYVKEGYMITPRGYQV